MTGQALSSNDCSHGRGDQRRPGGAEHGHHCRALFMPDHGYAKYTGVGSMTGNSLVSETLSSSTLWIPRICHPRTCHRAHNIVSPKTTMETTHLLHRHFTAALDLLPSSLPRATPPISGRSHDAYSRLSLEHVTDTTYSSPSVQPSRSNHLVHTNPLIFPSVLSDNTPKPSTSLPQIRHQRRPPSNSHTGSYPYTHYTTSLYR